MIRSFLFLFLLDSMTFLHHLRSVNLREQKLLFYKSFQYVSVFLSKLMMQIVARLQLGLFCNWPQHHFSMKLNYKCPLAVNLEGNRDEADNFGVVNVNLRQCNLLSFSDRKIAQFVGFCSITGWVIIKVSVPLHLELCHLFERLRKSEIYD